MMDDVFLKIKSRNRAASPAIDRTVAANVVPLQSEPREGKFALLLEKNYGPTREQKFQSKCDTREI